MRPSLRAHPLAGIIRGDLRRRNLSYKDLADRLREMGVKETEKNVVKQNRPRQLHRRPFPPVHESDRRSKTSI
jgi:Domain of unknown function (DUF6471)